ncbi:MAG: glycosyltransferase family 4 protein [Cyanobacteria bacterium J06592_8]
MSSNVYQDQTAKKKMSVIFMSHWFDNPYKKLLTSNLESYDVTVEEYSNRVFFVSKVLQNGKPDILHLQTLHRFFISNNRPYCWLKFIAFILQLLILKLLNVKVVLTIHEWQDKLCDGKHDITPLQAAIIGKFLSGIITHCQSTKVMIAEAMNLKDPGKVFVVPHGNYIGVYENRMSRSEARETLNIPEENFMFLLFGGIHSGKGTFDGIEAFQKIANNQTHLVIAGKSSSKALKEEIVNQITGWENIALVCPKEGIPDDEIQIYMNACDCVVLPYKIFTTSGVAILSMSYSRACIVPNSGFFKDVLDDQGAFLYEHNNNESLAQAMSLCLEKREQLLEMGKYNYQKAKEWDWNFVARKTYDVYQYCLEK